MIYAAGGIFSKQAAQSEFMSVRYCICYAIVLAFLIIYAGYMAVHIKIFATYHSNSP